MQPVAEARCGLSIIRARRIMRIVMRARICTLHRWSFTHILALDFVSSMHPKAGINPRCPSILPRTPLFSNHPISKPHFSVYLFRHRITVKCLPLGHVQSRGAGSLIGHLWLRQRESNPYQRCERALSYRLDDIAKLHWHSDCHTNAAKKRER